MAGAQVSAAGRRGVQPIGRRIYAGHWHLPSRLPAEPWDGAVRLWGDVTALGEVFLSLPSCWRSLGNSCFTGPCGAQVAAAEVCKALPTRDCT